MSGLSDETTKATCDPLPCWFGSLTTHSCPAGFDYDEASRGCRSTCGEGTTLEDGVCVSSLPPSTFCGSDAPFDSSSGKCMPVCASRSLCRNGTFFDGEDPGACAPYEFVRWGGDGVSVGTLKTEGGSPLLTVKHCMDACNELGEDCVGFSMYSKPRKWDDFRPDRSTGWHQIWEPQEATHVIEQCFLRKEFTYEKTTDFDPDSDMPMASYRKVRTQGRVDARREEETSES